MTPDALDRIRALTAAPPLPIDAPLDDWRDVRSVLAIRLDAMGDVLMSTPALRAIRQSARGARLTLLTSSAGAAVARHVPEVDEVLVHDPPWMKATPPRASSREDRRFAASLRARGFEAAAILTVHSQSALPAALLAWHADIPRRLAHARENPYQLLTSWVPEPEPEAPIRHEVRRQLDLVAHVGLVPDREELSFRVPPDAMRRLRDELLPSVGLAAGSPFVVVHPGASAPSRRYPPERLGRAAAAIVDRLRVPVVLVGGPDEVALVERVRAAMDGRPAASLAGRLSLGELGALLAVTPVLVANNSGPVHLAAALATPVVDLYALTNLQHGPWRVPNRVLARDVPCAGCRKSVCPLGHGACLTDVAPEAIVEAVAELLDVSRDRAGRRRRRRVLPVTAAQRPPVAATAATPARSATLAPCAMPTRRSSTS